MSFDVICFDCDSTLSKIEGIDELAKRVGLGDEMARLTDAAMNGEVSLESVYAKRLDLIRPDAASMQWLADLYIQEIVDDAEALFSNLLTHGKELHIISGGIRQAILPLAHKLGLPETHVHAVDVYFSDDGHYQSFDQESPLARNGGKAIVVGKLHTKSTCVMIGDGKTDMEAKQAGAYTIGFGGVVARPKVKALADFYTTNPSILSILAHLIC